MSSIYKCICAAHHHQVTFAWCDPFDECDGESCIIGKCHTVEIRCANDWCQCNGFEMGLVWACLPCICVPIVYCPMSICGCCTKGEEQQQQQQPVQQYMGGGEGANVL